MTAVILIPNLTRPTLSSRRIERVVGRSYEAERQWYHRLAHLFNLDPDYHSTVAIDETKPKVEETEVYVWSAVDVETFEVIHIEVSPGRSDLDVLLFVKQVLKRCRGEPVILVDRRLWYNWALDDLDLCDSHRETWGNGHWSKSGSASSSTELGFSGFVEILFFRYIFA